MNISTELERIENSVQNGLSDRYEGVMALATTYCGGIFKKFMNQGSVLELGPANGVMTDILYPFFSDYTIVDGADFFVKNLLERYPNIKGYTSLFEEYVPKQKYDNIVLGHVLEHVEEPCRILKNCSSWLNEGGRILVAVPNANSIHRQAAVLMGLLKKENQLNETDKKNGHRRVYNLNELKSDFENAGLKILKAGGYWLKPLSNAQIDDIYNHEMIHAFLQLGEKYPEIAGEIYVIAENK